MPKGLPPLRGIEHQIDFVPGSTLPNRPAYKTNPIEAREIQKQVEELLEIGHIRESLSPCAVPVLIVPKKDGTWRMPRLLAFCSRPSREGSTTASARCLAPSGGKGRRRRCRRNVVDAWKGELRRRAPLQPSGRRTTVALARYHPPPEWREVDALLDDPYQPPPKSSCRAPPLEEVHHRCLALAEGRTKPAVVAAISHAPSEDRG
nr:uncharacterized protein LOC109174301 [Ipomoea trifida]